jgi:hypothetical protein
MNRKPDILAELQQLAPTLAALPNQQVFAVPEGYFEQLSGQIVFEINKSEQLLPEVPAGYFDGLADSILGRIKAEAAADAQLSAAEELAGLSPTLAAIGKKMPYQTPRNYFDGLAQQVVATTENKEAKVVRMAPRRQWFKYAAAACVIGLLGFFAVRVLTPKTTVSPDQNTEIAKRHKDAMNLNIEAALQTVSTAEAENFLCENGLVACNEPKDENLQKELSEISEEDIEAFLNAQN